MKITLSLKDFIIEVFDEYKSSQTLEHLGLYENTYRPAKDEDCIPTSQHAIIIYQREIKKASAILQAVAGATSVNSNSVIIDNDSLIIRCCNNVFSLTIPDLNLNWMTEVDWATCFSIHKYKDSYISHGELTVSRIDRKGNVIWSFGGADIFVSLYEGNPFEMNEDFIQLTDFSGGKYKIDYNGETISYEK
ncbi:hypothetical protein [Pseudobacter ginsenosidimutans]|nr:hypothetical protein [Pseudobacter ginsenosidimutans]QEC44566.1 hypothetical protein FSB84_23880 [Pseudobacter ginsenosidimutans]